MRTRIAFIVLLAGWPVAAAPPDSPESVVAAPALAELKWHNRLIVLAAPSATHPDLMASKQALQDHAEGAADRRLRTIVLIGDDSPLADDAATVRARFDLPADRFTAVLVGLDGGAKASTHEPVDVAAWFARIDAMPMRARELAERSGE